MLVRVAVMSHLSFLRQYRNWKRGLGTEKIDFCAHCLMVWLLFLSGVQGAFVFLACGGRSCIGFGSYENNIK